MMQTYREVINQLVCEVLGYERAQLAPTKYLVQDLLADSVSLIDLMIRISDHFQITLLNEDMATMETLGDLYTLVEKYSDKAIIPCD